MTALVDSLKPGICPLSGMSGDAHKDVDRALNIARDELGIPKILEPADIIDFPDDLAMLTYISYFQQEDFKQEMLKEEAAKAAEEPEQEPVEEPVEEPVVEPVEELEPEEEPAEEPVEELEPEQEPFEAKEVAPPAGTLLVFVLPVPSHVQAHVTAEPKPRSIAYFFDDIVEHKTILSTRRYAGSIVSFARGHFRNRTSNRLGQHPFSRLRRCARD